MTYAFVDCRWSLDDPGSGRLEYLAGHIPGAAFLDVERDLSGPPGPGGRHPLPDGELVAYCGSGVTACVTLHRLHLRGRSGLLYPGSWSEWEQDEELPRERG